MPPLMCDSSDVPREVLFTKVLNLQLSFESLTALRSRDCWPLFYRQGAGGWNGEGGVALPWSLASPFTPWPPPARWLNMCLCRWWRGWINQMYKSTICKELIHLSKEMVLFFRDRIWLRSLDLTEWILAMSVHKFGNNLLSLYTALMF